MIKYSKDGQVLFEPIEHKYTNLKGERLTSVTTTLHRYINEFDPNGEITRNYAFKNSMTVEEVVKLWKDINEEACIYGTAVHNELEQYILTGIIRDSPYKDIVQNFAKIKFEGKIQSEVLLYNMEYLVAGQSDIIEWLPQKRFSVHDFKTNKELEKKSKYGDLMKSFLWKFCDVNFNHYQLQLSMYAYLIELKGYTLEKLTVLYINPETHEIEHHPCKYLKKEVIKILEDHKKLLV